MSRVCVRVLHLAQKFNPIKVEGAVANLARDAHRLIARVALPVEVQRGRRGGGNGGDERDQRRAGQAGCETEHARTVAKPGALGAAGLVALLTADLISALGNWVSVIVLPWLVLQNTGSPAKMGLVAAAELVPYLLSSVFGPPVADRVGLLFSITNCLYHLWLEIHLAKITTMVDQVLDVFYVTDHQGRKIEDAARLDAIREELTRALEADGAAASAQAAGG